MDIFPQELETAIIYFEICTKNVTLVDYLASLVASNFDDESSVDDSVLAQHPQKLTMPSKVSNYFQMQCVHP